VERVLGVNGKGKKGWGDDEGFFKGQEKKRCQ
jgi:hypothetical protein